MNSLAFPNMFSNSRVNVASNHDATYTNLFLLLSSDKMSLFGDPYFGTSLKRAIFEQNNIILKDLIVDEIYTAICTFMPQIKLERTDIKVEGDDVNIYANIKCTNMLNYETNLYQIRLTNNEEEQ